MSKYPKVNYIGNKEKISEWIVKNLPINEGTILDLFCGGCSIAYKFKEYGFSVITNDVLFSNYSISKALIENSNKKLTIDITEDNLEKYYTEETHEKIKWMSNKLYFDYEIKELSILINYSKKLKAIDKYIFFALLRRAMIRKIPYSRMNIKWEEIIKFRDEELSYLKYKRRRAYHNKTFLYHIYDNLQDYNDAVFDNGKKHKSYQKDAIELLKSFKDNVDIVYIDPPYPSTMNKYEEFYGAFDEMFNKEKIHIDFTNKQNFLTNIENILLLSSKISNYLVMSLNNKCKPSVEDIDMLVKKYNYKIDIIYKKHIYKVTGKENKNNNSEILIIINFLRRL